MKKLLTILFIFCANTLLAQTGYYNFTLASSARVSVGVSTASDSVLQKTLWVDTSLVSGVHTVFWDGKDNLGNNVAGSVYVRAVANNITATWEGIIGNTSSTNVGTGVHRGYYTSITGMCFANGYAYFCQSYSEAYSSIAKFAIGSPQTRLDIYGNASAQYSFSGNKTTMVTDFIATDQTHVWYAGYDNYNKGIAGSLVHAITVGTDAQYTFPNGDGAYTINFGKPMRYLSVTDKIAGANAKPTGLAVQQSGSYLYVAHGGLNQLKVLDKLSGATVQTLSYTNPRYIAIEGTSLWMVTGTNTIAKYTMQSGGTLSAATLTLSGVTVPGALGVSASGTISVIDSTNQVVRNFNTTTGTEGTQLGVNGGYSTSPTVTNTKFMFNDFRGDNYSFISYAPDGSFWLGDAGNYRELHYTAGRTFIETIMSMGVTYSTCVDPNDSSRVFGNWLEFAVNYSVPLTGSTGWSLVNNWGYKNLTNAAQGVSTRKLLYVNTLSNGRTYGFNYLDNSISELTSSGLRNTGLSIANQVLGYDGNLVKFSGQYNIGSTLTLKKYALSGFDGSGNPQWNGAVTTLAQTPTNTIKDPNQLPGIVSAAGNTYVTASGKVIWYNPTILYAGAPPYYDGYHLGAIKLGQQSWLWKTAYATNTPYPPGVFPTPELFEIGNSVNQNAGSNFNIIGDFLLTGYHGEGLKGGQSNIYNGYYENGLPLIQFGTSTFAETGNTNVYPLPVPFMAGNALSPQMIKVGSDIHLIHGDESYHGGIHDIKLSNLSVSVINATIGTVIHRTKHYIGDGHTAIYFINPTDTSDVNNVKRGDTVCIAAGTYPNISFSGLVGDSLSPIIITNCGGQVIAGNTDTTYCFRVVNSQYVKFTGTGYPSLFYGFKAGIPGYFSGSGMNFKDSTSDYEIDHYDAYNLENGFLCKIDPYDNEPGTISTGWMIKNVNIHDCRVVKTGGEGFYNINTASFENRLVGGVPTDVEPVKARNVHIHHNIVDSTGWDGIQVAASDGLEIDHNTVTNYGTKNAGSQQAGIIVGGKSQNVSVHDNKIITGTGNGFENFGFKTLVFYNNLLTNCGIDGSPSGQDAFFADDRPDPSNQYTGQVNQLFNNTFVNSGKAAIKLQNSNGTMGVQNKAYNNLIAVVGSIYIDPGSAPAIDEAYNVTLPDTTSAKFVSATDFHLRFDSPARNASSLDPATYHIQTDLDGVTRTAPYDAGAYEFAGVSPIQQVIKNWLIIYCKIIFR